MFDFYFDDPRKIDSGLFWLRALLNPLIDEHPHNSMALLHLLAITRSPSLMIGSSELN